MEDEDHLRILHENLDASAQSIGVRVAEQSSVAAQKAAEMASRLGTIIDQIQGIHLELSTWDHSPNAKGVVESAQDASKAISGTRTNLEGLLAGSRNAKPVIGRLSELDKDGTKLAKSAESVVSSNWKAVQALKAAQRFIQGAQGNLTAFSEASNRQADAATDTANAIANYKHFF